jgi:hypothetical protein
MTASEAEEARLQYWRSSMERADEDLPRFRQTCEHPFSVPLRPEAIVGPSTGSQIT